MARRHGRNGRVYMGLTSGGTAEPLAVQAKWSINFATEKADVTALGDTNKVYVAGLPDASGEFEGWYDDATVQTYTAASDGVARKFYLYPDVTNSPGQYWWGTVFPDFTAEGGVDDALSVKASWNAASPITKVG
jgi:hypothetical protein